MSIYAIMFYLLGAAIVTATTLAVTRRNVMHAIVCLALSFIGSALLLYLLGAPFLAVLEVVIYAGAIMVLFLFIVMTLETTPDIRSLKTFLRQWLLPLFLALTSLVIICRFLLGEPGGSRPLTLVAASPLAFGRFLLTKYWLGVEITSYLLFVALAGALYLGRDDPGKEGS
jgi:NADH-quinone oxidoreductase subunit J